MIKVYPLEGLQLGPKESQATQSAVMVVSIASWENGSLRDAVSPKRMLLVPSD